MQQNRYHYIPGSIGLSIPCYVSTGSIGVVSIAVSHYPVTIFIIFLHAFASTSLHKVDTCDYDSKTFMHVHNNFYFMLYTTCTYDPPYISLFLKQYE